MSGLDTVGDDDAARHLVVFYRTTCRFSVESLEQWRKLSEDLCGTARVWFVSDEPLLTQIPFWKGTGGRGPLGCADATIAEVLAPGKAFQDYGVPGTPTHVMLREGRSVLGTYVGVLDRSSVVRRLRRLLTSHPADEQQPTP